VQQNNKLWERARILLWFKTLKLTHALCTIMLQWSW